MLEHGRILLFVRTSGEIPPTLVSFLKRGVAVPRGANARLMWMTAKQLQMREVATRLFKIDWAVVNNVSKIMFGDYTEPSAETKKYQQVNDNMHKSMDIKFTGDADKDFLAAMIPHHQGAVDMAEVVLQHGKNPKIRQLAQEIITMQKKEIAEMKQLLKEAK